MRAARRVLAPVLLCIVAAAAWPAAAQCPQPRTTSNAPAEFYDRASPLAPNADTRAAEREYQVGGKHFHGCALCHGTKADGEGELSERFDPPPRNFRCRQTMSGIPDGQLFWIIRFGSPGTSMPAHAKFNDAEVWEMVLYLRKLAR